MTPATTTLAAYFALGLIGGLCLTPVIRLLARRVGALDHPDGARKTHKKPVPLLGGIALFVVFAAGTIVAGMQIDDKPVDDLHLAGLLLTATLVCAIGCWDDLRVIRALGKLVGQVLASGVLVLCGFCCERIVIGSFTLELGAAAVPLNMLWIVGCINALNLLDGADGLATLVGLILAAATAVVFAIQGDTLALAIASVLAGALLGFLPYNTSPATIYLGDAGSMLIGMVISVLALRAGTIEAHTVMPAVPLMLLAVPMFDALLAVARRSLGGQPIWQADRGHIHHRLLDRGLDARQTSLALAGVAGCTSSAAVVAAASNEQFVPVAAAAAMFAGLVHARFWGHAEWSAAWKWLTARRAATTAREEQPAASPRPALAHELSSSQFSDLWNELLATARSHHIARLEVSCGDGKAIGWRRDWGERIDEACDSARVVEARDRQSHGGWCRVRAVVSSDSQTDWTAISNVLAGFSAHWAKYPQLAPDLHLRIVVCDDESAPVAIQDDQMRAA